MSIFIDKHELAERKDIINPNLFTGSKDFTGEWHSVLKDIKLAQKDKYLDFTAICVNWAWGGISQYIAANKGETFTASAYVKGKAGSRLTWFMVLNWEGENGGKQVYGIPDTQTINATGDWQKTSFTFTMPDSGMIKPRIEGDGSIPFWIAGMKLERGTTATPWCPAVEDYAMKSDLATKIITQDVDINTLTTEGDFFVESNNLDHFPTEYRNQWYFLNVVNPTGTNRIKQTVTPDASDRLSWTMTRTGAYNSGTVNWASWLISDFANGKLLKI